MDQYSLEGEGALPPRGTSLRILRTKALPAATPSAGTWGLARDLLSRWLRSGAGPQLPGTRASSEPLEDNLDTLSLYSGDSDSTKLLEEYVDPRVSDFPLQGEVVPRGPSLVGCGGPWSPERCLHLPPSRPGAGRPQGAQRSGRKEAGPRRERKEQAPGTAPRRTPLLDCSLCGCSSSASS